jgi:MmyB-like transcription regulator ligand binding domain
MELIADATVWPLGRLHQEGIYGRVIAMAATDLTPMRVAPECAEFAGLVEAILLRRRRDPAQRRATEEWYGVPRAWTRDELCDVAYSSYRALLRGAVRRPPRREVVMEIADYLQCTMTERNQLLVAARYAIEHPGPRGAELQVAVEALRPVMDKLPLPAYAVGRDWTILLINDHLLAVLGLALQDVVGLPPSWRNVLRLLFDPALPVRALLEPDAESWSRLAAFSVMRFVQDNLLWQYEPWYQALITGLGDLPDFSAFWRLAQAGELGATIAPDGLASARITVTRHDGRTLTLQPINVDLLGPGFPGIVSFLAADAASSHVLLDLGVPSPANQWGARS